jgi:hypothetical protein
MNFTPIESNGFKPIPCQGKRRTLGRTWRVIQFIFLTCLLSLNAVCFLKPAVSQHIADFAISSPRLWYMSGGVAGLAAISAYIESARTFRRSRWPSDLSTTRNCPPCAYNLTLNESGVCPECGTPLELYGRCDAVSSTTTVRSIIQDIT